MSPGAQSGDVKNAAVVRESPSASLRTGNKSRHLKPAIVTGGPSNSAFRIRNLHEEFCREPKITNLPPECDLRRSSELIVREASISDSEVIKRAHKSVAD
jgi:hypothetical protein